MLGTAPRAGLAGAFTLPEGQGQMIAGVGYIEAPRTFDDSGKAVAAPAYRKEEAGAYIQYGLTDSLMLIVAPSFVHMSAGAPSVSYTGSSETAAGLEWKFYGTPTQALSIQAMLEPALGPDKATPALGDPNGWAGTIKIGYARSFTLLGCPAFADGGPGAAIRGSGWPSEARFEATLGLRPASQTMVLIQDFFRAAPAAGVLTPATLATTMQASVVQELSPRFSVQIGGLRTLAGRNAAREMGPFAALWTKF